MHAHLILFDFITRIILGEEYRIIKLLIVQFSALPLPNNLCGGRAGNVEDPNQAGVSVSAEI
jgi:hypothetical protein